jgi:ribosomal protein L2
MKKFEEVVASLAAMVVMRLHSHFMQRLVTACMCTSGVTDSETSIPIR